MNASDFKKNSLRQKTRSIGERQDALEQQQQRLEHGIQQFSKAVEEQFKANKNIADDLVLKTEALVEITGEDTVRSTIEAIVNERLQQKADQEKAAIDQGAAEGFLVKEETVSEKSHIVGRYKDGAGNVVPPGYTYLTMDLVSPPFREKLTGKAVGESIDANGGGKFEVVEIYALDAEKFKAIQQAKVEAAKAAVEAAKVAEEVANAPPVEAPAETVMAELAPDAVPAPEAVMDVGTVTETPAQE